MNFEHHVLIVSVRGSMGLTNQNYRQLLPISYIHTQLPANSLVWGLPHSPQ